MIIFSLFLFKNRGFLPWEAGDIDFSSHVNQNDLLHNLRTEFVKRYPDFKITIPNKAEIIIQPKRGFGGWVTIFFGHAGKHRDMMRINLDGYWCSFAYVSFKECRTWYKQNYLQHKMYRMYNEQSLHCLEQSNACLPNFNILYGGRGGTWKEFFVEK